MAEEDRIILAAAIAREGIRMGRNMFGLYGGLKFNIDSAYEFMATVSISKLLGEEVVYWLDKDDAPVELEVAHALKICDTLMDSYGRSLAGDQVLLNIHIDAYDTSVMPGATAQNLKSSPITPATAEQIAAAKVACNAPSS